MERYYFNVEKGHSEAGKARVKNMRDPLENSPRYCKRDAVKSEGGEVSGKYKVNAVVARK
ncbi:hypothetical protein [Negativicoccus succinicivorans]|uniref:hypothetical protein n=1 Tax=Negativicoccus succinicivorans TaxID=620903 RepID=UPI00040F1AC4|nr:hypothetical protein [Negativicoccus succinicivorans]KGF12208.1 hypothetical protein HMPREF1633_02090 [Tissierellia bacterium S5-A11]